MLCKATGIIILCLIQHALCVSLDQFFQLEDEAIHTMGSNVESDCKRSFNKNFRACGESFGGMCVLRDGGISLFKSKEKSVDFTLNPFDSENDLIAPFWCDIATGTATNITYGTTTSLGQLFKADFSVNTAFRDKDFRSDELFISTWSNALAVGGNLAQVNTFQTVIAVNDLETCVIFQYADNGIQWSTCGGTHAKVGIGISGNHLIHPASGKEEISTIARGSNVGLSGKYVYCIGEEKLQPITCVKDGIKYKVKAEIMESCDRKCVCQENGMFECKETMCPVIDGPQCHAVGDPHYMSWDGRRFDFQGDCEYVMAQPCESEEFVISADNVPCSRPRVTCARGVRIKVPGSNPEEIFIGQRRALYFNGVLQQTGNRIYDSDPDLIIQQHGRYIHVTLRKHGIYVRYDGQYRLYIQVSTMHRGTGKLCGLCGNYDGNRNNDPTSAVELQCPGGAIEKRNAVNESDCDANNASLADAQTVCSQMKQSVFSVCNQIVDPQPFIDDCVFDYCYGDPEEREDFICDAMANYASVCADDGRQPSDWRGELESCRVNCSEGMIFQQCGPACPRTCENRDEVCEGRCVEGCFCPDGKYLLEGKCVAAEMCTACEHNGVAVLDGQQIQPNCSTRCTCRNGAFHCEPQTCLFNGATCYAAGDPHYQTFDLRNFDFQGNCEYVLTMPCNSDEFSVAVRNEEHNERVTCADQVRISGGGVNIILGRGNGGTISVNGSQHASTKDGVILETDLVYISRVGGHPNVIFPTYGVRVFWDGQYRVEITVSTRWRNRLCGLCGNYNGDSTDDFMDQEGNALSTPNAFGNSWIVGSTTGCTTPEAAACDSAVQNVANVRCSALSGSFFQPCNAIVNPEPFEEDCVYDVCQCNDDDRDMCYCESLATYASACAAAGVVLPNWRKFLDCPMNCPGDTIFQQCGSLCPQTCDYLNETCYGGCAEGCFCPTGQIAGRDGACQPMSTCLNANGSAAGNHDGNKMTFILQALIATLAAMLLRY